MNFTPHNLALLVLIPFSWAFSHRAQKRVMRILALGLTNWGCYFRDVWLISVNQIVLFVQMTFIIILLQELVDSSRPPSQWCLDSEVCWSSIWRGIHSIVLMLPILSTNVAALRGYFYVKIQDLGWTDWLCLHGWFTWVLWVFLRKRFCAQVR